MSIVAEFAARLRAERFTAWSGEPAVPIDCPARAARLHDIRAVIFDVYGTLIDYWRPEFDHRESKEAALQAAFRQTADYFGFTEYLLKMNSADTAEKTLHDLYHGLIALDHEKARNKSVDTPEIRIDRIWKVIVLMLKRHGYNPVRASFGTPDDLARCAAYYYNAVALGGNLFPNVVEALVALKKDNIRLGIVSNAQFYTPIDLTLLIREQSENTYDDYLELFDEDLIFYSYEYGVAKPGRLLFEKLYNALYESHILPAQTVFVGNDLALDIQTAQDVGMKTALYCGDRKSTFLHDLAPTVIADLTFQDYAELPAKVSFHDEARPSP
jgi:putative hydrolase of the HAD superfamily